ncbi:FHA domain-containing protein [Curtobacterium oceanosedimentum]|uniref:FHA domain-containing protein n=1 Tax=Curtobacterium oceanosedimentum TaxID=465820 RepID=UPI000736119D|nr:FHA domain-containing protein [Curtobacterium oceanosedimentum]
MEREPVRDDDTVIRARPGTGSATGLHAGSGGRFGAPAPSGVHPAEPDGPPAAEPDDRPDGDPYGDTVIRPVRGVRPGAGPAADDTVLRGRPGRPVPEATPGGAPVGAAARVADERPVHRRTPSVRIGGRIVRLDRPLVVGRRPAAPRVVVDDGPVLVPVPSPSGQVSSSHLLVHAEGEAAVVEDLRSTNGTVVRPPGAAPFRMAAGASIVVLTGTLVEIGDGNVIEVLSPHLRVGPDDGLPPFPPAP